MLPGYLDHAKFWQLLVDIDHDLLTQRRAKGCPYCAGVLHRAAFEHASREELLECLQHLCQAAGNPSLLSKPLAQALAEHAMGNYRVLTNMAAELLAHAARHDVTELDEKLFFELFHTERSAPRRRRAQGA